jgi:hypothetical protein
MIRRLPLAVLLFLGLRLAAAERFFDFTDSRPGEVPAGWTNLLAGSGRPGKWEVQMEDVPPALAPISANAPSVTKRAVVAQTVASPEDERFPLLLWGGEKLGDFTCTVRMRIIGGALEQIAGLVFRAQDERNLYVVRASVLGGNLRFYKFVDGQRSPPIGPAIPFEKGRWFDLTVKASGNQFEVLVDGTNAIPKITDNSFVSGRIGFITKTDTLAQFTDVRLDYRPLETLAAVLVRQTLADQPRLLGVRLFGTSASRSELHCLAAKEAEEVGRAANETQLKVYAENQTYFGKTPQAAIVTAPAVGSTSRRMLRPNVVLPLPDSPTIPSVSPGKTSMETSSTAFTCATVRAKTPRLMGNQVRRLRTQTKGSSPVSAIRRGCAGASIRGTARSNAWV